MDKKKQAENFRSRVGNAKRPKFWFPETEGEFITGKVVNFRMMISKFGEGEVMDIEDDETGELAAVFLSSVIKNEREKQNIQIGEHVGIKYLGEVEGENATYKSFIVMVDREEAK